MLVMTWRPRPPTPTTAMSRRSLGAWNPRPSTWRGTIVNPAVAMPTVERNRRRERPGFGITSPFRCAVRATLLVNDYSDERNRGQAGPPSRLSYSRIVMLPGAASAAPTASVGGWRLEHTYAELPAIFHASVAPTAVRDPQFVVFNTVLATELGLDVAALDSPAGAAIFAGNALPDGARPLAQAYAGHQFGHFTGLGDGRAILLGEQITPDGRRVDIQLKGPGQTPYSRRGDGRAALGPMLRELVISEAMHALGIPTSRSLAVVATGEAVYRERPLPGAVLTRVAASHLRVGTFEWAAAHRDPDALRALADYTIRRHYPGVTDAAQPSLAFFDAVVERQAALIARWQPSGSSTA